MFHVELRQFPHVTRAFNLTREQLDSRILRPWVTGRAVELNERHWAPEKARLVVYEGAELATEELGLGRGWATVTRGGENVTARLLDELRPPPALEDFKREIIAAAARGISLPEVIELAGRRHPQLRLSERLALAEQAIWELLHNRILHMRRGAARLSADHWQAVLLTWETWTERGPGEVSLQVLGDRPRFNPPVSG